VTPTPPETDTRFDRAGPFIDGELLPIVTVAPSYPPRARAAQIEGHVVVEFTVTLTGAVKDAIVVESTHTAFERASIEAVQKFRYRPRVVDGQPVEVRGIRKRFTFVLEE
jgi:protein TonB